MRESCIQDVVFAALAALPMTTQIGALQRREKSLALEFSGLCVVDRRRHPTGLAAPLKAPKGHPKHRSSAFSLELQLTFPCRGSCAMDKRDGFELAWLSWIREVEPWKLAGSCGMIGWDNGGSGARPRLRGAVFAFQSADPRDRQSTDASTLGASKVCSLLQRA